MNEYDIYRIIELILFSLYLVFIFLSIQIWLLWRDINKNELDVKIFVSESFFKKNCLYVLSFSVFFMIHEVIEGTSLPNAMIYFEFFEMLGFISVVLFSYDWYLVLKTSTSKKSLPQEFTDFTRQQT
ncbi:MAG: hypothetical protein OIN66_04325 [Candidatus Methanoperedens sp.]|nr:hypothetical protein [Candidatus Methanoperedens sp.]